MGTPPPSPPTLTPAEIAFREEFSTFEKMSAAAPTRFSLNWQDRRPFLDDKTPSTAFDRHYVYHPAWAARVLAQTKPDVHVDVSSIINFCAVVSAFIPVEYYEYQPRDLQLSGLTSGKADLLALPFADASVKSLSCMHVVEHVGLGRYGDPLDPEGDLKAIAELTRVLAPQGTLLFVVPVGQPRLMFNAHRIYSYAQVVSYFPELTLEEFALIPDDSHDGGLVCPAPPELSDAQEYGCGCFWFRRES